MDQKISELRKWQLVWLEERLALDHSPKTAALYGQCLVQLNRFLAVRGCTRPADVSAGDLASWRTEMIQAGLKPASVAVYVRAVRGWTRWLTESGQVFSDPAAELRGPRIPLSRGTAPSEEDMMRLVESVDTRGSVGLRDRAILETAYATAMRRSELADIAVADVDLNQGVVRTLGKGGRERMVPLTPVAVDWLRRYLLSGREHLRKGRLTGALWLNQRGRPISAHSLARMIVGRARKVGLGDITPHGIRRACATHLLDRGARPAELRQLLGHASFKHLNHYLRLGFREMQVTHRQCRLGQ